MDRLLPLFARVPTHSRAFLIGTSVASTLAILTAVQLALYRTPPKVIHSPLKTILPNLSKEEHSTLPYPPDVFPGARDINSPYGSIRVYEWGPESGRKVLMLHGISTPCLSLGGLANALVERGCRVMLLDLWGRGYTDAVDLPHDPRLYATEILLAITSSPLAWTPEGFSLIGYSLGGGISADFASSFPALVRSVVLLAPGGLIRPYHFRWRDRLMYQLPLPASFVEWIVRRRIEPSQKPRENHTPASNIDEALSEEIRGAADTNFDAVELSKERPGVTVASAVKWQLEHHPGFVPAFVSSFKYASTQRTEETFKTWQSLGRREDKVIIFTGSNDPLIIPTELEVDAKEAIGAANVEWRVIEGGHEFPITRGEEIANDLCSIWGL